MSQWLAIGGIGVQQTGDAAALAEEGRCWAGESFAVGSVALIHEGAADDAGRTAVVHAASGGVCIAGITSSLDD